MLKRIIRLLLIVIMAVAMVPVSVYAEEMESTTEKTQLLGLKWPDEWNDQQVVEDEPNDSITSSSGIYSPNWLYNGDTVVGTIGFGCYPKDGWDNFEFYVSETGTVEIVALTRYSDKEVISGTTISYSAFEVELQKKGEDGRTYTTVASAAQENTSIIRPVISITFLSAQMSSPVRIGWS